MTISTTTNRVSFAGNGSTTAFATDYKFFADGDLSVILVVDSTGVETTQTLTTHYTVAGEGVATGGTVTMVTAPAVGETLVIVRAQAYTQTLDLVENDPFPSSSVEDQLDKLAIMTQQNNDEINRSVKLSDGDTTGASTVLATPVANAYILWDNLGTSLTSSTTAAGQFLGGDGTVSLPFYSFTSDANSGFYRIGADNVALSLGGVKSVDFLTTGTNVTGTLDASGDVSGATFTADGDTSAGDTASMGYNATEGLVLTGQGSTNDVSIKNDAAAIAIEIPTGTQNVNMLGDLAITGDLTVSGTTTTVSSTVTTLADPLIELNTGAASNANDLGIVMERGSTGDNAFMGWDESADKFAFGTTTATGASTGNISYTDAQILAGGLTLSGTSPDLGTVTTIDIDGGTVDGAIIGGGSAAAGTFTTVSLSTSASGQDAAGPTILNEAASATNPTLVPNKADTDTGVGWNTTNVGSLIAGGSQVMSFGAAGITLATGASVTGILDEDTMDTDSDTQLATQQSIKAYVDNSLGGNPMTTQGDMIRGAASGALERVAIGAADTLLTSDGTDANWVTAPGDVLKAVANTFSATQSGSITALTSTTNSIAVDLSLNNHYSHTFTENTTLANPTNIVAGTSGSFFFTQHASSPKTLAFGSYYDFAGGTAPTVTATNSARDRIDYIVRSATLIECVWTGALS